MGNYWLMAFFALAFWGATFNNSWEASLRVMTFNLRYANPADGPNRWEARKDFVIESLERYAPAVIGIQEGLGGQIEDLISGLPQYQAFGRDRSGQGSDEYSSILYDKSRLKLIEGDTFWLSETPEEAGSQSWDSSLPRIATWALFEGVHGRRFLVLNTHFDHRGQLARVRSAELVRSKLEEIHPEAPRIVLGDFNALPESDPYKALVGNNNLSDAWTIARERRGPEFTFHGFTGQGDVNLRIDWILVGSDIQVKSITSIDDHDNGLYLSDHFPVMADLEIR
ncbi:MAG: endonuclease/exonuclease/phosphatase family protein [Acidobacteriota bacterium]